MRVLTAYEFETLADRNNFIVVYPDGVGRYWNACRKRAGQASPTDDTGFMRALIKRFRTSYGISASHVFVMGFSNGGQMAYRLALEAPEEIGGIAAVAANLPTPGDSSCTETERPVAVMIVNGTADPSNPYAGGRLGGLGFGNRGQVRSSIETATYFSRLAGYNGLPNIVRYPERDGGADTWVERATWDAAQLPEVSLYTVHGGGHTIPQGKYKLRRILGPTAADIDCMEEVWQFFVRQMRKGTGTGL